MIVVCARTKASENNNADAGQKLARFALCSALSAFFLVFSSRLMDKREKDAEFASNARQLIANGSDSWDSAVCLHTTLSFNLIGLSLKSRKKRSCSRSMNELHTCNEFLFWSKHSGDSSAVQVVTYLARRAAAALMSCSSAGRRQQLYTGPIFPCVSQEFRFARAFREPNHLYRKANPVEETQTDNRAVGPSPPAIKTNSNTAGRTSNKP
jgi:hypothetical protein